jgi:hypothetical protein
MLIVIKKKIPLLASEKRATDHRADDNRKTESTASASTPMQRTRPGGSLIAWW